ncbi:MAG: sigma 54-interacting transcriptional regulator [Candidatus Binatia bacterium]
MDAPATSPWRARFSFDDILGRSAPLQKAIAIARRAAEAEYPTLLVGASGTGKELFAHAIHTASGCREGPFVAVNCGTLCGDLAVAEMCGYEPGSFTGADRRTRPGILDGARGGTLFLDELQDMPPTPQSVLLRFLETGTFVRVGGTRPVQARTRVIGASNVGLDELERNGVIRSDLLYRLNCLVIEIPPLRERREDIRPIADRCLREELHFLGEVDEDVWTALERCPYKWPGNARGLRNILLKAILASAKDRLSVTDLPQVLWAQPPAEPPVRHEKSDGSEQKVDALRAVLGATGHNVSETARRLGVHRSTVYRRLARPDR